ncbi:MAG TPA: metallophosphoesterase [Planctomicrobium sp.]|nr:metallophosphoesterase [Planctomicrobium sp.]
MLVGIFSDTHDHLDNIRRAVAFFNERECRAVLFAGDLVSTFAIPPLRQLNCPIYGCFGDNEGNRIGIQGGFKIIGQIKEAPAAYTLDDNTRIIIAHMPRQLRDCQGEYDIAIHGHTHRPLIKTDDSGRLVINPGEASGWTYGQPTVALLETTTRHAEIIPLDTSTPLPTWDQERRS